MAQYFQAGLTCFADAPSPDAPPVDAIQPFLDPRSSAQIRGRRISPLHNSCVLTRSLSARTVTSLRTKKTSPARPRSVAQHFARRLASPNSNIRNLERISPPQRGECIMNVERPMDRLPHSLPRARPSTHRHLSSLPTLSAANIPASPATIWSNPPKASAASLLAQPLKTFMSRCKSRQMQIGHNSKPCPRSRVPQPVLGITCRLEPAGWPDRQQKRRARSCSSQLDSIFPTRYLWHIQATICRGILLTGTTGGSTLSIP